MSVPLVRNQDHSTAVVTSDGTIEGGCVGGDCHPEDGLASSIQFQVDAKGSSIKSKEDAATSGGRQRRRPDNDEGAETVAPVALGESADGGAGDPSWDSPQTPPINCQWNLWSDWTECTETCGGGDQGRQRDRKVIPENGGEECHGPRQESQACNEEECPSTTDVPVEDHATDISHTEGETGETGANKTNTANASIVIEAEEAVEKKKGSLTFILSSLFVLVVVAGGGLAAYKLYEQHVKQKSPLYDEFGEPLVTEDYDTYDDEGY